MQIHFCFVPLSRARIAIRRTSARMYLRCNTYTRVKGGYVGRGTLATESIYLYPLPVYWPPSRAQHRPSSGADVAELSLPTPHGCGTIFQRRLWSPPWTLLPTGSAYSYIIFAREILGLARRTRVLIHRVLGKNRLVTVPPATGADRDAPFFERYIVFKRCDRD